VQHVFTASHRWTRLFDLFPYNVPQKRELKKAKGYQVGIVMGRVRRQNHVSEVQREREFGKETRLPK
jgi:hypothetical protein